MDLENVILSEVSHTEKEKYHIYHFYVESKNMTRTYLQNRNRFTDIKNRLVVAKREEGGKRQVLGLWN